MTAEFNKCGRAANCSKPVAGRIGKPVKDETDPSVFVCLEHGIEAHNRLFEVEWEEGQEPEGLRPLMTLIFHKHQRLTGSIAPRTDRFCRWLPGQPVTRARSEDSMTVSQGEIVHDSFTR